MIFLDTHVVVWLFVPRIDLLTKEVKRLVNAEELSVSPMVLLELDYLRESGRIASDSDTICRSLQKSVGLTICDLPFLPVVQAAVHHTWTRDPFDRIIVGHAAAQEAPLITKDRTILAHYPAAVWT